MNTVQYYGTKDIPEVPNDFDGAVASHALSLKAIRYWLDEIKTIDRLYDRNRYDQSKKILNQWRQCKQKSSEVISTYQLKMFD